MVSYNQHTRTGEKDGRKNFRTYRVTCTDRFAGRTFRFPAMYNYSFAKLGLDYAYVAFDVKEDQVKEALDAVKLFHMRGINVTMPDKTEAAKYVDELSPAAQIIGAVNTIVNDDGRLTGYITDGEGFVHNLTPWRRY